MSMHYLKRFIKLKCYILLTAFPMCIHRERGCINNKLDWKQGRQDQNPAVAVGMWVFKQQLNMVHYDTHPNVDVNVCWPTKEVNKLLSITYVRFRNGTKVETLTEVELLMNKIIILTKSTT